MSVIMRIALITREEKKLNHSHSRKRESNGVQLTPYTISLSLTEKEADQGLITLSQDKAKRRPGSLGGGQ